MKDIKVYGHDHFGELVQMADGYVVYFEDHLAIVAALQEQVRELAAEAEGLKNYIKSECFIMEVGAHPMAEADISAQERMPENPATDAALRDIRAQAVELASRKLRDIGDKSYSGYELECLAKSIRSGEQP